MLRREIKNTSLGLLINAYEYKQPLNKLCGYKMGDSKKIQNDRFVPLPAKAVNPAVVQSKVGSDWGYFPQDINALKLVVP